MGRYEKSHWVDLFHLKNSKIKDKETGNEGEGAAFEWQSYKEADKKAWDKLQEKNRQK